MNNQCNRLYWPRGRASTALKIFVIGDSCEELWYFVTNLKERRDKLHIPAKVREFSIEFVAIRSNQPDVKPTNAPIADIIVVSTNF